jgi:hypothetical protein
MLITPPVDRDAPAKSCYARLTTHSRICTLAPAQKRRERDLEMLSCCCRSGGACTICISARCWRASLLEPSFNKTHLERLPSAFTLLFVQPPAYSGVKPAWKVSFRSRLKSDICGRVAKAEGVVWAPFCRPVNFMQYIIKKIANFACCFFLYFILLQNKFMFTEQKNSRSYFYVQ